VPLLTTSTSVFGDEPISTHADPTSTYTPRDHMFGSQRVIVVNVVEVVACWPIPSILGFWGAKFTKIGDSLPWTPIIRRAKFDADSFILGGEIRNRTNKETNKHTQKQYNDISTPCLSACVDNDSRYQRLTTYLYKSDRGRSAPWDLALPFGQSEFHDISRRAVVKVAWDAGGRRPPTSNIW